jgi:mono/diheme cytochrome c family protein
MCLFAVLFLSACVRPSPAVVGDPARGAALFSRQQIRDTSGCASCHSLEPGRMVAGPSLADVATRARVKIASTGYGGEAATVQDDLRESITRPTADLAPGFAHGIMPDWLTVHPAFGRGTRDRSSHAWLLPGTTGPGIRPF